MRSALAAVLSLLVLVALVAPGPVSGQTTGDPDPNANMTTGGNATDGNATSGTGQPTESNNTSTVGAGGQQEVIGDGTAGSSPWPPLFIVFALALFVGYLVTRSTLRRNR